MALFVPTSRPLRHTECAFYDERRARVPVLHFRGVLRQLGECFI